MAGPWGSGPFQYPLEHSGLEPLVKQEAPCVEDKVLPQKCNRKVNGQAKGREILQGEQMQRTPSKHLGWRKFSREYLLSLHRGLVA